MASARYQKRISGLLLDRIDIHLEASHIDDEQLADRRAGEPSAAVRARVEAALADTQRLPDAACNQKTLGTGIRGPVPHLHDFDQDEEYGCYHRNPALPSQRSQ